MHIWISIQLIAVKYKIIAIIFAYDTNVKG